MTFTTANYSSGEESDEESEARPRPVSKMTQRHHAALAVAHAKEAAAESAYKAAKKMISRARADHAEAQHATGWLGGSIFESNRAKAEREEEAFCKERQLFAARVALYDAEHDHRTTRSKRLALEYRFARERRQRMREAKLMKLRATSVKIQLFGEQQRQLQCNDSYSHQRTSLLGLFRELIFSTPSGNTVCFA